MDLCDQPQTDIERIWGNLSSFDQKLLLQKLIETSKSHRSPAPIPSEEFSVKRVLQSPETPHRGGSRKVYLIYIKLLICRVVQKLSSINTTNL